MLFHRKEEKYRLSLTDKEYRLLLDCLMIRRNKLLAEGRYPRTNQCTLYGRPC